MTDPSPELRANLSGEQLVNAGFASTPGQNHRPRGSEPPGEVPCESREEKAKWLGEQLASGAGDGGTPREPLSKQEAEELRQKLAEAEERGDRHRAAQIKAAFLRLR